MSIEIVNEDILDDGEPVVYVQRYVASHCTYRVFRNPTSPDEEFEVSPEIVINPDVKYNVGISLNYEVDPDDDILEVFASVFVAEDVLPVTSEGGMMDADPYANIVYDPERRIYRGEAVFNGFEVVETIETETLDEALLRVVEAIDPLVAADRQP